MVQSVTYQSEKQSVYFQGKLIVLENLIPVLSPDEKNKRKREIENHLYDVFSKYTDRFYQSTATLLSGAAYGII